MVGMKGGLTDGENCRETFRDRNDSAFDRRWRAGTKASDGNENAKADAEVITKTRESNI